jgi:2-keto-4-pentenoate hydratase
MQGLETDRDSAVDAFCREMLGIFKEHQLVRQTALEITSLTLEEAYKVQDRYIAARVSAGENIIGWKIGCTSRAIQQQFGLTQPICGRLMKPHIYSDNAAFSTRAFVDCAVEPEMVFFVGRDLLASMDAGDLRKSVSAVSAGVELHNYRFWYGKPSSQELITSNGIHAGLVVGQPRALSDETDLDLEAMSVLINDVDVAAGMGAEIMEGPLNSLRWLVLHLAKRGLQVRRGDLVIPGSAVKLVRVAAGDKVEAKFVSIGSCRASFHS